MRPSSTTHKLVVHALRLMWDVATTFLGQLTDVHADFDTLNAQVCKALGFRQDDLVAISDVIAGKSIAAACSALWSVASACEARSYKVRHPSDCCLQDHEAPLAHKDCPDISAALTPLSSPHLACTLSGNATQAQSALAQVEGGPMDM